jgi:hypothetical protein
MAKARRTVEGHLLWDGGLANGYPAVKHLGKTVYLKRLIWEEANGTIPKGLAVISTCGERACIETRHLGLTGPGRHGGPRRADGRYAPVGSTDDTT